MSEKLTPSERRVISILQTNPGAWLWIGENEAFWRVALRLIARGKLCWAKPGTADYLRLP